MTIFRTRWRIVRDLYCGYEVQYRPWWSPFWVQHGFTNTHSSIERAREYLRKARRDVVEEAA